jgi:non-ribosomal peptide synthetase component E (peptide arylation enzyme)
VTVGTSAGLLDECATSLTGSSSAARPRRRNTAFLDERGLMRQKWPERIILVDEFPLAGLGKVAKSELARQIAGGPR